LKDKLFHRSVLFSLFSLATVLRLSNYDFVFANLIGHLNFVGTDPYYYLRRLVHFLANFPQILQFDPLIDWPAGSRVDWPEGFILLVGIPLKLFGVSSFRGLELGASFISILLGLITCWVVYILARRVVIDRGFGLLAFFFAAVNFLLIRFSCLGQLDHHIIEALTPPLVLLLSFLTFLGRNQRMGFVLGVVIGYSLMISSANLFMVGAFFMAYVTVFANKESQHLLGWVMAGVFLILVPYVLWRFMAFGELLAFTRPSFFHLTLLILLSGASFFLVRFKENQHWILMGAGFFGFLGWLIHWPKFFFGPLNDAFSYVFGRPGILQNVSEAAPIFLRWGKVNLTFIHGNFGYLFYLLPVGWIALLYWRHLSKVSQAFLLFLTVLSIPTIAQKRFSHIIIGLYLVFLCWLLKHLLNFLKKEAIRVGPFVSFAFIALMALPTLQFGFSPGSTARHHVDLPTIQKFLNRTKVDQEQVWNRLALKEAVQEGVWANPNQGHLLLYATGLGVVTNSFYHPKSLKKDLRLRSFLEVTELHKQLQEWRIKYAILADDFKYFKLLKEISGQSAESLILRQNFEGKEVTVYNMVELEKFAWVKLLVRDEVFEGFNSLFRVQFFQPHFYTYLQGFEVQKTP